MKKEPTNKEKLQILDSLKSKYYLMPYLNDEDIDESLEYVQFVKRFFIKLHKNKDINVNLLVNHLIMLFNCFHKDYIIKYLILAINPAHLIYLKTILLYMKKIDINHCWFKDVSISYDFDYLLRTINRGKYAI